MDSEKLFILVLGLVASIAITQISSCMTRSKEADAALKSSMLQKGATLAEIECVREIGSARGTSDTCNALLKEMSERANRAQAEELDRARSKKATAVVPPASTASAP